jgi:hypothetical protein
MKFVLVPLFMLLMLAQTFSKWFVVIDYQLNRDFVAKALCINKARPRMHCNGQCQVMKKLAEEEKQNSSSHNTSHKTNAQELIFFDAFLMPGISGWKEEENVPVAHYTLRHYTTPAPAVFHPPA